MKIGTIARTWAALFSIGVAAAGHLPEGGLVHPQQRPQFLIERGLRPHPPAVIQRDREAPHLAVFAAGVQVAEMTPIHLRLFTGGVSNRRTAVYRAMWETIDMP